MKLKILVIIVLLTISLVSAQDYVDFEQELGLMGFTDTSFITGCESDLCSASAENKEIFLAGDAKLFAFIENLKDKELEITFHGNAKTESGEQGYLHIDASQEGGWIKTGAAIFEKGVMQVEENNFDFVGGDLFLNGRSGLNSKFTNTNVTATQFEEYVQNNDKNAYTLRVTNEESVKIEGTGRLSNGLVKSGEGIIHLDSENNINFYLHAGELTDLGAGKVDWLSNPHPEGYRIYGKANNLHICNEKDDQENCIVVDGDVIISTIGVECRSCIYQVYGSPKFGIYEFPPSQTGIEPKEIIVGDSEIKHKIKGVVKIKDNHLVIPTISEGMVDGLYIKTDRENEVDIYLEELPIVPAENYVFMDDKKLQLNGNGFKVALGTEEGAKPTEDFDFDITTKSDYLPDEDIPYRLIFDMQGGNVVLDKENMEITTEIEKEQKVEIINGNNKFLYSEEGYDYQYIPCFAEVFDPLFPGQEKVAAISCAEVPYLMNDGGSISVVGQPIIEQPAKIETVDFQLKEQFGAQRSYTDSYELETNQVYVLGYRGGEAAQQTFGEERERQDWGHVGLLYYRDGEWWIAESEGANVKIGNIQSSLFGVFGKLDGLYQIQTNYPEQVIQRVEELAGTPYAEPGVITALSGGIYCSNLIDQALESADDIDEISPGAISFTDTDPGLSAFIKSHAGGLLLATPREIIESPYLTEINPS